MGLYTYSILTISHLTSTLNLMLMCLSCN